MKTYKIVLLAVLPLLLFGGAFAWMSHIDNSVIAICEDYHIDNGMDKHAAELYCRGI